MSNKIHATAIVDPSAILGSNNEIGAYSIIGPFVEMGDDNWIGPHVVINGPTKMGNGNKIFQFASVGEGPQDLSYKGEPTRLEMGDRNMVRENVTIHRGTVKDKGLTKIGSDNLFMASSHIAHDCIIQDHTIFLNSATLAGHVEVHSHAIIGAFCAIHQFARIGAYAMLARACLAPCDIPPYVLAVGPGGHAVGLNKVGLLRHGFTKEVIQELGEAYKILYRGSSSMEEALDLLRAKENVSKEFKVFLEFVEQAQKAGRGILRISREDNEE